MIKLIEIVEQYMIEDERDTSHKKWKYINLAIQAVKDLHYDISGYVKAVSLAVDTSKNICNLPDDFVREVGVAVVDYSGNLINLSRSPHKIFKSLDDCGNISSATPNYNSIDSFGYTYNTQAEHFRNGQNIGNWFGIGGQQVSGDYTINKEEKRIEFSSRTNNTFIVLKYLCSPSQLNGQFEVHEYLQDAIMNYIEWKDVKRGSSLRERQLLHANYVNTKVWARMRLSSFDVEEAKEIAKVNFTQAPKM